MQLIDEIISATTQIRTFASIDNLQTVDNSGISDRFSYAARFLASLCCKFIFRKHKVLFEKKFFFPEMIKNNALIV